MPIPRATNSPCAHQSLFEGAVLCLVMLGHVLVRDQRVDHKDHQHTAKESQVGRPNADGLNSPLQQLDE